MLLMLIIAGVMGIPLWKLDNSHRMAKRRIEKENKRKK
jgi:high-affinity Fe2+/Pb2+ permease